MRISDWSSDVCSSDLPGQDGDRARRMLSHHTLDRVHPRPGARWRCRRSARACRGHLYVPRHARRGGQSVTLPRSEEHTSELQSLMRKSYAVFCLKKKITTENNTVHL